MPQLKHGESQGRSSQAEDGSLDKQASMYLERNSSTSVQELHDALSVRNPSVTHVTGLYGVYGARGYG